MPTPVYSYMLPAGEHTPANPAPPRVVPNPIQGKGSFSVHCMVTASTVFEQQPYSIAGSLHTTAAGERGWEMGVQPNGAWFFYLKDGQQEYTYYPTRQRQPLYPDKPMAIGFAYHHLKEEVWLYYDGTPVAILHTPGLQTIQDSVIHLGGRVYGALQIWEQLNGVVHQLALYDHPCPPTFFAGYSQNKLQALKRNQLDSTLTIMTFNIWHGGKETGKETGIMRTAALIQQANPDVVAIQETYGSGAILADLLGYYYYLRSSNLSILSRYPIDSTGPAIHPFYHGSAYITIPQQGTLLFSTVWLNYPFDYWDALYRRQPQDTARWVAAMRQKNADTMQAILRKIEGAGLDATAVVIAGDFNTGSHLDWTANNRVLNHGYAIPFPTTLLLQKHGFEDSYRQVHPNATKDRGLTWSPYIKDSHQDRIDYIFYKSAHYKALQSFTTQEGATGYPSDHRGVVTVFKKMVP